MKKSIVLLSLLFAMLTLSSCGEKQKAKKLVKTFLTENLQDNRFGGAEFSRLDSTFFINDSVLSAMQTTAMNDKLFKRMKLDGKRGKSGKLMFIHVRYFLNADTIRQTFYMDENLERVISFKKD